MMSPPQFTSDIGGRLAAVSQRVANAAERVDRNPSAVTIVAVSKSFGAEVVEAGKREGILDFGENRAQELAGKAASVRGVRWHFIGRLQRNKARDVVGLATLIHSVDRLELAETIADHARRGPGLQRVLVQVNAGDDPAKAGCSVADAPALVAQIRAIDGLACEGLMTIPAMDFDPRPAFRRLRQLRDELRTSFPEVGHLSMGMTHDFEVAVEEGATIVRLGEALFGPRPQSGPHRPPEHPPAPVIPD